MNQSKQSVRDLAMGFVMETNRHIFITGRAGTGKTTLLHEINASASKKIVVAAPTGVAAVNASGVTLHSLFKLPTEVVLPVEDLSSTSMTLGRFTKEVSFTTEKEKILLEMEVLLIDEVSMLRADMLDAIDAVLRKVRANNDAFGGVQLVMIGDLYQLPPVVATNEASSLLRYYASPNFFAAKIMSEIQLVVIELTQVFRQNDPIFLKLLNNIRQNTPDSDDMEVLSSRLRLAAGAESEVGMVRLTSHRKDAEQINRAELERLPGEAFRFQASAVGAVDVTSLPVEQELFLKQGAQVMFVRNDPSGQQRYFNGKIGRITKLTSQVIEVTMGDGMVVEVGRERWEFKQYVLMDGHQVVATNAGEFWQYPLRLAWAITVHKSQGLTFDGAIVDVGSAFSPGQAYVALSRLRTLQGLVLKTPITTDALTPQPDVAKFMEQVSDEQDLAQVLSTARVDAVYGYIRQSFQFYRLMRMVTRLPASLERFRFSVNSQDLKLLDMLPSALAEISVVSEKFLRQLDQFWNSDKADKDKGTLRLKEAATYFGDKLREILIGPLDSKLKEMVADKAPKDLIAYYRQLEAEGRDKLKRMETSAEVWRGLMAGGNPSTLRLMFAPVEQNTVTIGRSDEAKHGRLTATQKATLKLLQKGKQLSEIAQQRSMSLQAVEAHVLALIELGEISLAELVTKEKCAAMTKAIKEGTDELYALKALLGDEFSYFDIRAAMATHKRESLY